MDVASVVAIVVALLSVAGAIAVQIYQFKKDSNTIGSVKADTNGMVPVIHNIEKNTEKARDEIVEKLVPNLTASENMAAGVQELLDEQRYQKRVKSEATVHEEDILIAGVKRVYEENARLADKVREQAIQISDLQHKYSVLQNQLNKNLPRREYDDFER